MIKGKQKIILLNKEISLRDLQTTLNKSKALIVSKILYYTANKKYISLDSCGNVYVRKSLKEWSQDLQVWFENDKKRNLSTSAISAIFKVLIDEGLITYINDVSRIRSYKVLEHNLAERVKQKVGIDFGLQNQTFLENIDEQNYYQTCEDTYQDNVKNQVESGSHLNETGTYLNETGSRINESGTYLNESGSHLNETGSHLNETGSHLNETGSHLNESGSHLNETGTHLNESGSHLNESGQELNIKTVAGKGLEVVLCSGTYTDTYTNTCTDTDTIYNKSYKSENSCESEKITNKNQRSESNLHRQKSTVVQDMFCIWKQEFPQQKEVLSLEKAQWLKSAYDRVFEEDFEEFRRYLKQVKNSEFLASKGHLLTLKWLLNFEHIADIRSGKYDSEAHDVPEKSFILRDTKHVGDSIAQKMINIWNANFPRLSEGLDDSKTYSLKNAFVMAFDNDYSKFEDYLAKVKSMVKTIGSSGLQGISQAVDFETISKIRNGSSENQNFVVL